MFKLCSWFTVLSSLLSGVVAFLGFCVAYRYDLPVGPTDVILLGLIYGLACLARKIFRLNRSGRRPKLV